MDDTSSSKPTRIKDSGISAPRRLNHEDYTVGWICAISCELTAALAAIDERHEVLTNPPGDNNIYSYGTISGHNVVISCLPEGIYGTTAATVIGTRMLATFRSITIPLMVGIGGGVPSSKHDIRLADVVSSVPTPDCPAVVQYDYGETVASGKLEHKGSLNKPSLQLLAAVSKIRADLSYVSDKLARTIEDMIASSISLLQEGEYPDEDDVLYGAGCEHVDELVKCSICGPVEIIKRPPRPWTNYPKYNDPTVLTCSMYGKFMFQPLVNVHYG